MKKYTIILIVTILGISGTANAGFLDTIGSWFYNPYVTQTQTLGAGIFQVFQGGTGASTLTGCLEGNGTGPITGTGSACGSGSGSGGVGTSTNPFMATYFVATSTTAASTFAGGITGPNSFTVQSSSGNVGIGTTGPSTKLGVNGIISLEDSANSIIRATNGGIDVLKYDSVGQVSINSYNGRYINIAANGSNGIYIAGSEGTLGNVGIGTTAPGYKLHVDGTIASNLGILAKSYNVAVANTAGLEYYSGYSYINSHGADNSTKGGFIVTLRSADDSLNTEAMRILPSGNVGIGTTTPVNKLTVAGDIGFYGTIPTLSSCGTSPSITKGSTDGAFEITQGSVSTGCTITFGVSKTNTPFCTLTDQAGAVFSYTTTNTAITVVNIGVLSSTKMNGICVQNNN